MKWYSYLIVLIILILVSIFLFQQKEKTVIGFNEQDKYKPGQNIITTELKNADLIQLTKKEFKSLLIKKNNNWFLERSYGKLFPVDEQKITNLIDELKSIKVDMIVSTKKEKFAKLGVDDSEAFKVIFKNGTNEILHFNIGNNNESFTGTFVRKDKEDITLQTNKRLESSIINAKEEFWLNKEVLGEVKLENIKTIYLVNNEKLKCSCSLNKSDNTDTFYISFNNSKIVVKKEDVQSLVNNLNHLSAADFAADTIDTNVFEKIYYECEIKYNDGKSNKIIIGKKSADGKNYYLKNIEKEYIYLIDEPKLNMIFNDNQIIKELNIKPEESKSTKSKMKK